MEERHCGPDPQSPVNYWPNVIAGLTRNPLINEGMLNQVQHDAGRGMLILILLRI
jgi:hypothetical protein